MIKDLQAKLTQQTDQYNKLQSNFLKCQQEKAALLEDQRLRGHVRTEREEKQQAPTRSEGSSTIPTVVDEHRVTTESLMSEETNETIFDDVAVPVVADPEDLKLQVKILQKRVSEQSTQLQQNDMEVCYLILIIKKY